LPEIEENLALVVRRGSVVALNLRQQTPPRDDVNQNKRRNEKERDDRVGATPESVECSEPATGENKEVDREKKKQLDGVINPSQIESCLRFPPQASRRFTRRHIEARQDPHEFSSDLVLLKEQTPPPANIWQCNQKGTKLVS